jgi:hypothetical protein
MKWEYKTLKVPATGGFLGGKFNEETLTAKLNEMGEERWDLVSAFSTHQGYGQSRDIVALFKRERR